MSPAMLQDGYSDVPPGKLACVVTSLEMVGLPPIEATPAPDGWVLRQFTRPDPDWYRALFRHVGEPWLWVSRLHLSDAELAAILHDPAVEVLALTIDGIDQGLVELDFRQNGVCELVYFGLAGLLTGQGVGRWLIAQIIDRAWRRPIGRFWVHTCTLDHPAALRFYMRNGFVPFRRQIEVFDDPRLTGLLPADAAPDMPRL